MTNELTLLKINQKNDTSIYFSEVYFEIKIESTKSARNSFCHLTINDHLLINFSIFNKKEDEYYDCL